MKLLPGLLIAFSMCAATILAQTSAEETTAVLQAERDGCIAYLNGEAEKIANFLTEDYTLTNSKGEISGRADDIADATSGKVRYDLFENYDMKVRLYGDSAAVVTGRTKLKGVYDGKTVDKIVQFTDTLVKQNGRWRLAAGHVSPVAQ
ncbi:MAG: nuclear transport factor 2 family protein [Verrucomicrobia bacterium]|nr:MAG: nuclear transport factor 2 family protein [Verrucomicrobiota bacterium]